MYKQGLSEKEWEELVTLDYVLTWHYTDEFDRDLKRYKELSDKREKMLELYNSRYKKLKKLNAGN